LAHPHKSLPLDPNGGAQTKERDSTQQKPNYQQCLFTQAHTAEKQ
jgi:hypothetical protein